MEGGDAEQTLRFAVLGPVRAWRGDAELDLGPGKQRAVLAVLLLTANRPVPASRIVDAVWDDAPPANGTNVVQKYVAGLRRVLEPDRSPRAPSRVLTLEDGGYRLNVADLDAQTFESLVRSAESRRRDDDADGAALQLRRAVQLWQGQPLAGLSGRWFETARQRLGEGHATAWESLAEIELELGLYAGLASELSLLVEEYPGREGLRAALMLALYRSGRQVEALAAYRDAQRYLGDEFGVDPGARLQELHQRILASDPSLTPAAPSTAAESTPDPDERPAEYIPASLPLPAAPAAHGPPPFSSPPYSPPPHSGPPYSGPPYSSPPFHPPPNGPPLSGGPPVHVAALGPPPRPTASRVYVWMKAILLAAIPLFTCGTGTWVVIGYLAVRRRSLLNAVSAILYATFTVMLVIWVLQLDYVESEPPLVASDLLAFPGLFVSPFVGAVHTFVLALTDFRRPPWALAEAADLSAQMDRMRALQILTYHPHMALELRIGRPDLPRWFGDGGLIDVNAAPEYVLARVPCLTFEQITRLMLDREMHGPYQSVHDLVRRHPDLRTNYSALHRLVVIRTPTGATYDHGTDG
ncbi:BTAD domain-containing putative transcriptional regulator [Cryptosporangium aurantiacum]|uniref:DNA-binding transcriptional activator of the SARP family n=1 Tax=Cryptosporangium aurantiacum TaxID=134849 RepID=A0A1M7RNA8_9ACTN|nr:BTAD domain-containing putative transcriptional regulator [Cryptosporangium aurantiacum]SHN47588.1 DNA-binding transcriptional activator of the SARP family [Cryptosporangium aurantiacum]